MMLARDRISFLYLERGVLEVSGYSLVLLRTDDNVVIPAARSLVLLIGPGVSVSHAAVRLCAAEDCLLLWCGEQAVRIYGAGNPRAKRDAIVRQVALFLRDRIGVARRIYRLMLDEKPNPTHSIERLMGIEGGRAKAWYMEIAARYRVRWDGRSRDMSDPVNTAISVANAALYGVTEAAILAMGYSPSVGFIHSGDARSFVFDVADTVKFKTVVPLAFRIVSESNQDIEGRVRRACRDMFFADQMIDRLVNNIESIINNDLT
jgi:CRISPR-associated protein Cas1